MMLKTCERGDFIKRSQRTTGFKICSGSRKKGHTSSLALLSPFKLCEVWHRVLLCFMMQLPCLEHRGWEKERPAADTEALLVSPSVPLWKRSCVPVTVEQKRQWNLVRQPVGMAVGSEILLENTFTKVMFLFRRPQWVVSSRGMVVLRQL